MNNIQKLFQREQKLVIPYLLAGYPDIQTSKEAIDIALSLCPAIELGVAFSDPIADGPTLQRAHSIALSNGANLSLTLEIAKEAKAKHPQSSIILMTYLNPVHKLGFSNFTKRAFGAGIDALLIPDLPAEESAPLLRACKEEGISLILLASLSTKKERLKRICELSDPFVYLVSIYGTTGSKEPNLEELKEVLSKAKKLCQKPIAVGFGISNSKMAKMVLKEVSAAIVGSLLAKALGEGLSAFRALIGELSTKDEDA